MDSKELTARAIRRRVLADYIDEQAKLFKWAIDSWQKAGKPYGKKFADFVFTLVTDHAKYTSWTPSMINEFAKEVAEKIMVMEPGAHNPLKDKEVAPLGAVASIKQGQAYLNIKDHTKEKVEKMSKLPSKMYKDPYADKHVEHPLTPSAVYGPVPSQTRYDPENPGVQMGRVKDRLYRSPVGKDGKYTANLSEGHLVEFEPGAAEQTTMEWYNKFYDKPLYPDNKDAKDLKNYKKEKFDHTYPDKDKDHQPKERYAEKITTLLRKAGAKGDILLNNVVVIALDDTDEMLIKYTDDQTLETTTVGVKTADLNSTMGLVFGPVTEQTLYNPNFPGIKLARVTDHIYQCPVTGEMFNFEKGFTKADGTEVPGGSVANMTPDIPGFYTSPHPPVRRKMTHEKDASDKTKKVTAALDPEMEFINSIGHILYNDKEVFDSLSDPIKEVLKRKYAKGQTTPLTQLLAEIYSQADPGANPDNAFSTEIVQALIRSKKLDKLDPMTQKVLELKFKKGDTSPLSELVKRVADSEVNYGAPIAAPEVPQPTEEVKPAEEKPVEEAKKLEEPEIEMPVPKEKV